MTGDTPAFAAIPTGQPAVRVAGKVVRPVVLPPSLLQRLMQSPAHRGLF